MLFPGRPTLKGLLRVTGLAGLVLCATLALQGSASAQSRSRINGRVVDSKGEAVIGASVLVEGDKNTWAITDLDGKFSLNVASGSRLNISSIGFTPTIIKVGEAKDYVIRLKEDSEMLQDVVVVGYGTQKKESVVGAISSVKGDALVGSGMTNITGAMAGKLSGVVTIQTTGQPGQNDAEILIRGVSSFGSSAPLVLVDGVERDFASIDPNEVADLSVLKDASATAVFGAKGANGVIIVTTKSGSEGKPKMDVSFSSGLANPINLPEHVDSYTTMSIMNVAMMNDQNFSGLTSEAALREYKNPSSRLMSLK